MNFLKMYWSKQIQIKENCYVDFIIYCVYVAVVCSKVRNMSVDTLFINMSALIYSWLVVNLTHMLIFTILFCFVFLVGNGR